MRAIGKIGRTAAPWIKRFLGDRNGNVAMMFGLSGIVVVAAGGGALDWSRAMVTKARLGAALDAAALAVGTASGLTQPQAEAKAQAFFDANYPPGTYGTPGPVHLTMSGQIINLTVDATVPTTLLRISHIDNLNLSVANQVVKSVTKLHVALVLDNTGSMCEPSSSPCPGAGSTTKIYALKAATHQLLTQLQAAAVDPGDVQVALIPFSLDVNVGTSNVGASWIDWTDWDAAPPSSMPSSSVGPGSTCPYGTGGTPNISPYGYRCTTGTTNGSSNTNSVPSNGRIIPGKDSGTYNIGRGGHYYNGYYDSVATQTSTSTTTDATPIQLKQTCKQTGSGPITCTNNSGYPKTNGSTTSSTTTVVTSGYSGSGGPTTTTSSTINSINDGAKSCTGSGATKKCTWTRTTNSTQTDTTVSWTGVNFNHTWHANAHSSWGGCIMDRDQDYDADNTVPSSTATKFPAENATACPPSPVRALAYDWSGISSAVDAMEPNGNTNQTIGFSWGWQALTEDVPLSAPAADPLTQKVIIILSDGLNTQNRWTTDAATIDARETLACQNARTAGVIVYTLFLDIGGASGNSAPLQNCATDITKYFDLTTTGEVLTAFTQIGTELANLHLSL